MTAVTAPPGIALEILEERHAPELFALTNANRAYLMQWLPWLDGITAIEDTRAFIAATQRQNEGNNGFQTAIVRAGAIVGVIGHHGVDWQNKSCSLGYWLAEAAQGCGIMTDCCRAYVNHAFDVLGLHRVEIRCAEGNARSRAIPERLGFKVEGVVREVEWLYDRYVSHVIYSMLSAEWGG
jgi:ribosomal-protein-serine acetyltransferase